MEEAIHCRLSNEILEADVAKPSEGNLAEHQKPCDDLEERQSMQWAMKEMPELGMSLVCLRSR